MRPRDVVFSATILGLLLACARTSTTTASAPIPASMTTSTTTVAMAMNAPTAARDTLGALRERAVAAVLRGIAGRENEPAGTVFKNVKELKDVPARQFLEIMNNGFGHGLGVSCGFCHVPGQWASDQKPNKDIARDMVRMVDSLNMDLSMMTNLPDTKPRLGCITCHRMAQKPELIGTGG